MTAQKGSLVVIKVGNGGSPTETFTTIGGLRITTLNLNNQIVNASNLSNAPWKKSLSGAGSRSLSISGNGVFTDAASEETLRGYAFANSANNYEIHFGNGDKISGAFQIASYSRTGNVDDEETYAITLESAGEISFS